MNTNSAHARTVRRSPERLSTTTSDSRDFSADNGFDLVVQQDHDLGIAFNLVDQVPRHVLREVVATDEEVDPWRVAGEKHRSLAGRVATTDDRHRVGATQLTSCTVAA